MKKLVACKGKLYELASNALFRYWEELPEVAVTTAENLGFSWNGGMIPFELWEQIVAFMRWTQKEFKGEGHCTLFYNLNTKEWKAWPFPQQPMGMTVKLLENDPQYAIDRKQFGSDWVMAGSVHHHCEASAFQSGTDSADEKDKEGIHITVGHVLKETVDLHARKVMNGAMHECSLAEFIAEPEYVGFIPKWLRKTTDTNWKEVYGNVTNRDFPEEWKPNVRKEVFRPATEICRNPWHGTPTTLIGGNTFNKARHIDQEINDYIDLVIARFKTSEEEILQVLDCDPRMLPKGKQQTFVYQIQAFFNKMTFGGVAISSTYIKDKLAERLLPNASTSL